MIIAEDLKKLIEHGDWKIIAELFNKNHNRKITSSYVLKVVRGDRAANKGTTAEQILPFVEQYLQNKKDFRDNLTKSV